MKDSSKLDQVLNLLTEHIQEFKKYKVEINKRFDALDADIKDIKIDINILKEDVAAMNNIPTMKKELKLM